MKHRIATSLLLIALAAFTGCGYDGSSAYNWSHTYRTDVQTVAVPIFTSKSFVRGDELRITQALVNQIESRTPYKVAERTSADTILEGQITKIEAGTISSDRISSLPREQMYTVTINFTWKDLRTGQILVDRRGFEQTVTYYPPMGEGRSTASQSAAEQLAGAIVSELQSNW